MPTVRQWRQYDRDRADAELIHRAATWLREDPKRAPHAGLSHDEDAHALARCSTSSPPGSPRSTPVSGGRRSSRAGCCSETRWPPPRSDAPDAPDAPDATARQPHRAHETAPASGSRLLTSACRTLRAQEDGVPKLPMITPLPWPG